MENDRVTVYEKPTCSKFREVRKVLTDKGIDFATVNYFEEAMGADLLSGLLQAAGLKPQDAVRRNEPAYRELVAGKELSDEELVRLMAAHPELIQRRIVVRGSKAVLARPTEKLSDLGI